MRLRGVISAAGVILLSMQAARAQSFDQFIGFGDSTIDSGYYRALPAPGGGPTFNSLWAAGIAAGAGAPTTNPGPMSSQALASHFGLSANPANQPGGTNYATSGAKNVTLNDSRTGGFTAAVPTVTQIANYLAANNGVADPNALYLISSGGNDITYAAGATGSGPFPADPAAYIVSAANSLVASIASLQTAGARYIVVPNQPFDFAAGPAAVEQKRLKLIYSQTLWRGLAARGVDFIEADINAFRHAVKAKPAAFGFKSMGNGPGQTACAQPPGVMTAWALLCSSNPAAPSRLVAPDAALTHLFADNQHLTTAGQKAEAEYEYRLILERVKSRPSPKSR